MNQIEVNKERRIKMRSKLFIVISIVLVVSLSFMIVVGCKATEAEEVSTETEEAEVEETAVEETETEEVSGEPVVLTSASWRAEDVDSMTKINAVFTEGNPNIIVEFNPLKVDDYYAALGTALTTASGVPDLFGTQGWDIAQRMYEGGYLSPLNDLVPELVDYTEVATGPFTTEDGIIYAGVFAAVGNGVYYNKDIFDEYGLTEPETWDELWEIAETLKDNGVVAFSTGSLDSWTLETFEFDGLGPAFWGGEAGRKEWVAGTAKFTDPQFVAAFEAMDNLKPYLADGFEAINYTAESSMFVTEQSAMFFGGTWEIRPFQNQGATFNMGWFPCHKVNKSDKYQMCWVPGKAWGLYSESPYQEEAAKYLAWLITEEGNQAIHAQLPGFFGYTLGDYSFGDPLADEMFTIANDAEQTELTIRVTNEYLDKTEPTGVSLLREALQLMMNGDMTPYEAAEHVQSGLEESGVWD